MSMCRVRRVRGDVEEEILPMEAKMSSLATRVSNFDPRALHDDGLALVVGLGASAGGLESLQRFFRSFNGPHNVAFVVVQHLAPQYKSMMVELLQRSTSIPVTLVNQDMPLLPNNIYQISPSSLIVVEKGYLRFVSESREMGEPNSAVNVMLTSLAKSYGPRAAAVILSGTGSDGRNGVVHVKEKGGYVLVQDESAKFSGMPDEALRTGFVDYRLSPEALGEQIGVLATKITPFSTTQVDESECLHSILQTVELACGVSFAQYKSGTVKRRILNRMNVVACSSIPEYLDKLKIDTAEATALCQNILIGVTGFFRDVKCWEVIQSQIVPRICKDAAHEERSIRVWTPGCSTGEESYSIAILFKEYLDSHGLETPFKVYATDLDIIALATAKTGLYASDSPLDPYYKDKYFKSTPNGLEVKAELKKHMLFSKHNVATDPPFKDMDLIICRNLLIYFERQLKVRVLAGFHFALRPSGVLFLGISETTEAAAEKFTPLDEEAKIYAANRGLRTSLLNFGTPSVLSAPLTAHRSRAKALAQARNTMYGNERLMKLCCETFGLPCFVVDESKHVVTMFGEGQKHVAVTSFAEGQKHATTSFNPHQWALARDLGVAVTVAIPKCKSSNCPVVYKNVSCSASSVAGPKEVLEISNGNEGATLHHAPNTYKADVIVARLAKDDPDSKQLYAVFVIDHSTPSLLRGLLGLSKGEGSAQNNQQALLPTTTSLVKSQDVTSGLPICDLNDRISSLEKALDASKRDLSETVMQLEAANEELQSTNEELVASNEELQSTNEELQSVNEELYTVNCEYGLKIEEMQSVTSDMSDLVAFSRIATVFLDPDFAIRKYTSLMSTITTLRPSDIGRPLEEVSFLDRSISMRELVKELAAKVLTGVDNAFEKVVVMTCGSHAENTYVIHARQSLSGQYEDPHLRNELVPIAKPSHGGVISEGVQPRIVITFTDITGSAEEVARRNAESSSLEN